MIGSRYIPGGGVEGDFNLKRKFMSTGINMYARLLPGPPDPRQQRLVPVLSGVQAPPDRPRTRPVARVLVHGRDPLLVPDPSTASSARPRSCSRTAARATPRSTTREAVKALQIIFELGVSAAVRARRGSPEIGPGSRNARDSFTSAFASVFAPPGCSTSSRSVARPRELSRKCRLFAVACCRRSCRPALDRLASQSPGRGHPWSASRTGASSSGRDRSCSSASWRSESSDLVPWDHPEITGIHHAAEAVVLGHRPVIHPTQRHLDRGSERTSPIAGPHLIARVSGAAYHAGLCPGRRLAPRRGQAAASWPRR